MQPPLKKSPNNCNPLPPQKGGTPPFLKIWLEAQHPPPPLQKEGGGPYVLRKIYQIANWSKIDTMDAPSCALKKVRYNYNCSAYRSAHLIAISSHSLIKQKQPKRIFLQHSCSVTIINIVKKFLWRKIHKLKTSIGSSDDSHKYRINVL